MRPILIILGLAFLLSLSLSVRAQDVTLCDNAKMWLEMYGYDKSVEIIDCTKKFVSLKPVLRGDGSYDTTIWNAIQDNRKLKGSEWMHDNVVFSWLQRNGKHSYRQKDRPSAQISFHDFTNGIAMRIKIDFDRFAPGGNGLINSARHFIQELFPNLILRRKTDQIRMKPSLERQFQRKSASAGN